MARRVKTNLVLSTIVLIAPVFGGCSMLARDKPGYSVEKQYVSDPAIDNPPAIQSQTHLAAGMVSEQNGQLQQAESSYKAALALEPDNSKALFSIARLLNSQKKYDQSIPYWESLVRVNKGTADSYSNLGYTYMLAERDSNSEQAFGRAISADPKHRRARLNYSQLLARQGRMQDAATQMSAILPPAAVHFNLGLMYEPAATRASRDSTMSARSNSILSFVSRQTASSTSPRTRKGPGRSRTPIKNSRIRRRRRFVKAANCDPHLGNRQRIKPLSADANRSAFLHRLQILSA